MRFFALDRYALSITLAAGSLAACGGSEVPIGAPATTTFHHSNGIWRSFEINGYLEGLVRAENGDFWATAYGFSSVNSLSRITPGGKVTIHHIGVYPQELAIDASGNFWLTTAKNEQEIVEISPRFKTKTFSLSSDANGGIIIGRDGNTWFTESFAIGKITPAGKLTQYPTPAIGGESGAAWGAHGLIWFFLTSGLASIDSTTGALNVYTFPYESNQGAIVAASDGAIWFVSESQGHQILVRFDPESNRSSAYELPIDVAVSYTPGDLIQTADGAVWIGTQHLDRRGYQHGAALVRFDVQSKTFTEYKAPKGYGWPWNLAAGPAGSIWATAAFAVYELTP